MTVTITVQAKVSGQTIASSMIFDLETLERLSCSPGEWFESVLADLKSSVATEAKIRQELNAAAETLMKGLNEQTPTR